MLKILLFCILVIWVLNIITYVYFRAKHHGAAELFIKLGARDGQIMTYCIPDYRSNAAAAFHFLAEGRYYEHDLMHGGMTYVKYSNWGFDANTIARQILENIKEHDYLPYIISIGLGDQIARIVEKERPDLTVIAVNPLPNKDILFFDKQVKFQTLVPLLNFFVTLLGWFAQIRCIKTDAIRRQSLSLYADQLNAITYSQLPVGKYATSGLVLSFKDSMVDYWSARSMFKHVPSIGVVYIETCHANTRDGAILYLEKMRELLHYLY